MKTRMQKSNGNGSRTLADLINEYDCNGFCLIDDGNGSAGPAWVDWSDEDVREEFEHIAMYPVRPLDCPGQDPDDEYDTYRQQTFLSVVRHVLPGYHVDNDNGVWASEWIVTGKGDNPYRFRVVF